MKITGVPKLLDASFAADDSVMITGLHGIGKSEVVKEWSATRNIYCETIYLSMFEIGDLLGMPNILETPEGSVTRWAQPDWFQHINEAAWPSKFTIDDLVFEDKEFQKYVLSNDTKMTRDKLNELYNKFYKTNLQNAVLTNQKNVRCKLSKKTALFTDEFSRATPDVHNACLQLILEKRLHSHILPFVDGVRTFIIAGDNPDNGDYTVNPLDPATLDRFLSVDVQVDVQGWLDWARKNKVHDIVRAFIADNPSKLYFQPEEGNDSNIGATPRSWTKLSKYIFSMIPEKTTISYDKYIEMTS